MNLFIGLCFKVIGYVVIVASMMVVKDAGGCLCEKCFLYLLDDDRRTCPGLELRNNEL